TPDPPLDHEAGRRLRGGTDRAAREAHGACGRHRLGRIGHGTRKDGPVPGRRHPGGQDAVRDSGSDRGGAPTQAEIQAHAAPIERESETETEIEIETETETEEETIPWMKRCS